MKSKGYLQKSGKILFAAALLLAFISCVSSRTVRLLDLITKESPTETEIILTTSNPVQFQETKLENPPCLIISFPEDKIISNKEEELKINKGPIKRIKNEYYMEEKKGQRLLNFVVVELTQDVSYTLSNNGSSIILKIESPPSSPALPFPENSNKNELQKSEKPLNLEPGYIIGPEDILSIEVWKHPDISREVEVNHKGEITIPPFRNLSVIGLTTSQLEEKLAKAFSKYILDPIVFVTVKQYNSQRVIALGEVNTGMYTLKRKTTLVEFLGQIGDMAPNADTYHIKLIKKDGKVLIFDLNELLSDPEKREKVFVSAGDTVYVPPLDMNKVLVLGEVTYPKALILKGKMTVADAIAEAGGYTRDAVLKSVIVIRGDPGSQKGIRVSLKQMLKEADVSQNIELKPGDIVYVPKTFIVNVERFLRNLAFPLTWYFWYIR